MSWQTELQAAAADYRKRKAEEPKPWWVYADGLFQELFSEGTDTVVVTRVLLGMRAEIVVAPTDREGVTCHLLGGREFLVAREEDMPALMRCVRLSGYSGYYRKAGIPKGDPEYREYRFEPTQKVKEVRRA